MSHVTRHSVVIHHTRTTGTICWRPRKNKGANHESTGIFRPELASGLCRCFAHKVFASSRFLIQLGFTRTISNRSSNGKNVKTTMITVSLIIKDQDLKKSLIEIYVIVEGTLNLCFLTNRFQKVLKKFDRTKNCKMIILLLVAKYNFVRAFNKGYFSNDNLDG